MKSPRKSRTENPNARQDVAWHGTARSSRGSLSPGGVPLTGRAFRRANRLDRGQAARLEAIAHGSDGAAVRPTLSLVFDQFSRAVVGFDVTTS